MPYPKFPYIMTDSYAPEFRIKFFRGAPNANTSRYSKAFYARRSTSGLRKLLCRIGIGVTGPLLV